MKLNKRVSLFVLVLVLVLATVFMSSCDSSKDELSSKSTITLWTGGSDNVKNAWQNLAKEFNASEEYGKDYEMKIEHIASGTGATSLLDRVVAAYKAKEKDAGFDIIEVSTSEYSTYLAEGGNDIFMKIDTSKIPNYPNLKAKMSGGAEHIVPYRGTTVVLAYNEDMVPNPPTTADEMYQWIKDNPGQYSYCTPGSGGSGASFVMTSLYNFLPEEALSSKDEKWMSKWSKGFDFLTELHPYMYKSGGKVVYPHKNQGTLDLLANGQIAMTPAWVDMVLTQLNQGTMPDNIKMTQIRPGFTGELASLAIPASSQNSEGAHKVLDFMLSVKAQEMLLEGMAAFPVIDISKINSENAKKLSKFKLEDFRTSDIGGLSREIAKKWDEVIAILD